MVTENQTNKVEYTQLDQTSLCVTIYSCRPCRFVYDWDSLETQETQTAILQAHELDISSFDKTQAYCFDIEERGFWCKKSDCVAKSV